MTLLLLQSYEPEFRGHHSTPINDMFFTVFFFPFSEPIPKLWTCIQGTSLYINQWYVFLVVFFFIFRDYMYTQVMNLNSGASIIWFLQCFYFSISGTIPVLWTWIQEVHSTSINNNIFTVFYFIYFFHFQRL